MASSNNDFNGLVTKVLGDRTKGRVGERVERYQIRFGESTTGSRVERVRENTQSKASIGENPGIIGKKMVC